MSYKEKLKDPRWQKKRLEVLNRDNWTCQCCSNNTIELQVHHLKYSGNPWEVNKKHLITLCCECHKKVSDATFMKKIRDEIAENFESDMYILKTHVRYFTVENNLTLIKSLS